MAVLTSVFDVQMLEGYRPAAGGMALTLADGRELYLAAAHPSYRRWLIHVESKLRDWHPIGFAADEQGHVLDLNGAHSTTVYCHWPSPNDPDCIIVGFWAYSPACAITRDQPEFDALYATIAAAAGTPQSFWVATHTRDHVREGPDEDGRFAELSRIMVMRPQ